MIVDTCQRWALGREHRRPAGEIICPSDYEVALIGAGVAKSFVAAHHYAGTCSSTAHPFGLHRHGELVGVACFGPGASVNAHRAVFPTLTMREGVTLGRLVLLDDVPGNGESWFVAQCFRLLRLRGVVAVESCADPEPRSTDKGELVHRGHVGTVYSALNGRYVGKTNDATLRLLPDGTCFSNRASGKIVRGEQGRVYAGAELVDWGATPLADGEDPKAWVKHWRAQLTRPMRHRGNHRYLWSLDKRRRAEILTAPALPYPKLTQLARAA